MVIKHDLSEEIENSGFKGKFVIGISAQPLDSTNWLDFGDYGPVIIDIGTKSYTTSLNTEPDSRLQKFKFKLYIITDDGDKKFDEEVIYDVIITP